MSGPIATPEQLEALDLFACGYPLAIEAGAGTGKTTTLTMLAGSTTRRGRYVAFNRSIVADAEQKMPGNVACSTAHSLAFRAHGHQYRHRLNAPRMRSQDQARRLDIHQPLSITTWAGVTKVLSPGWQASHTMRAVTRFCQTADPEIGVRHFPWVDGLDDPAGRRQGNTPNNQAIATALVDAARRAWTDLQDPGGQLPYRHDHYLKAWQLHDPHIACDFLMFDEAQDADPVMLDIVRQQTHAHRVFVGDTQQQIYAWRGAVNAMANLDPKARRTFLTKSWRFGPAIAAVANDLLAQLDADLCLEGNPTLDSRVERIDGHPDVILTRTNAVAVATILRLQRDGIPTHLVGGADDVVAFAKAAIELRDRRETWHHDLSCFTSWAEVRAYVDQDPQGDELKLLVNLVDEFTPEVIIRALGATTSEDNARVVVSTAHKAKGREWPRVRLAHDFPDLLDADDSELRLAYVAATRARHTLDLTTCPLFTPDRDDPPLLTTGGPR